MVEAACRRAAAASALARDMRTASWACTGPASQSNRHAVQAAPHLETLARTHMRTGVRPRPGPAALRGGKAKEWFFINDCQQLLHQSPRTLVDKREGCKTQSRAKPLILANL